MTKNQPHVLVVDDDEIVLAAVTDLLEAAQFKVSCHASPAGAVDLAAANPLLAAVVLDLNMPIMRGDNVARMFMSRATLRDVPILFLSGDSPAALSTVRSKLPNVKVVAKSEMATALVPALRAAIAERGQRTKPRAWGSEPSPGLGADPAARQRFFTWLATEMDNARELWRGAHTGELQRLLKLAATLRTLQGEAERSGLGHVGGLLRAMEQVALTLHQGAKLRLSAESSMQRAIDALAAVAREQDADAGTRLDAIADAVRRAGQELRP